MLYTDGIPEALDQEGEAFGFERLESCLEPGGSAAAVHDRILAELERLEVDATPHDDRSLVVIQRIADTAGGEA